MAILVTGGMGYIGSHTVVELLNQGEDVVIVDDLSNSNIETLEAIKTITGKTPRFYKLDINNDVELEKVFSENNIESVIHFAGLKSIGESVQRPLKYYGNNISGTLILLDVMHKNNINQIIFSSSASVYGRPSKLPITEDAPLSTTAPYGTTKLVIERILQDLYVSDNNWRISILRYFNPVGAHPSSLIGESLKGTINNLMPYLNKVAIGKLDKLSIFGGDYDTHDGTGVRDYIHVVDLAKGHLKALQKIRQESGVFIYNLGTGTAHSVLDLVKAFEKTNGVKINYEIVARRPADVAACYADPNKAKIELNWQAEKTIEDMCRDAWNFEKRIDSII